MDTQSRFLSVPELSSRLWRHDAPLLLDVRRDDDFAASARLIPGAIRRSPQAPDRWMRALPATALVVYCAHGRSVSQGLCAALADSGFSVAYLEGGFAAWESAGLPTLKVRSPLGAQPSRWITRERPKIDRIACPWLIRRFIDPLAQFFYVPTDQVRERGRELNAIPYDIPAVEFSHDGERCSFDAFLRQFELRAPGLDRLATIVRGADTARLDLAPQAPGLLAVSLGLSLNFADDPTMLAHGLTLYDALYAWCRFGQGESHDWKPDTMNLRA